MGTNYTFKLIDDKAREVYIAGDFNKWDPKATPMEKKVGYGNILSISLLVNTGINLLWMVTGKQILQ